MTENRTGLVIVAMSPVIAGDAELRANNPASPSVQDISTAQLSDRLRQRMMHRPIATPRHRSNMIRFDEPQVTVMRIDAPRAVAHRASVSDDCDLPPAA